MVPTTGGATRYRIIAVLTIIGLVVSASALYLTLTLENASPFVNNKQQSPASDQDRDGVPDAEDVYDSGDAKLIVSIERFTSRNSADSGSIPYSLNPTDPFFVIGVDYDSDGILDDYRESRTIYNSDLVIDPFFASFDIPDNASSITFFIAAYDDDFERGCTPLDFTNDTATAFARHTISSPFEGTWEDGDNLYVEYGISYSTRVSS